MSLLALYLIFGAGVYTGVSCARISTFKGASKFSIAKGAVLGLLLWPVGLGVLITQQEK